MHKLAFAALVAALLVCSTSAISIKWTGYANNNQWSTSTNWYPDQVPSTGDDVTITEGTVIVTQPSGVNSLMMGTSFNGPANLTIDNTFIVGAGGMTVDGNGNVFLNSGAASITGKVDIAGNLYFQSGSISGQVTVSSKGVADLSGAAQKIFVGAQFISQGQLTLSGIVALNQSSVFTVASSAVASGAFSIQAQDSSAVLFDASAGTLTYNGGGTFSIQAPVTLGTVNFNAGNLSVYSNVHFVNSFAIPSGSFVATVGSAIVNMSAGVTGAGVLSAAGASLELGLVNMTGDLNIVGGNTSFVSKCAIALLTISGGIIKVNAPTSAGMLNLMSGQLEGSATLTAVKGYVNSQGFDLNTAVVFTGAVNSMGKTLISFGSSGSLELASSAQLTVQGPLQFTGVPGRTVTNNGVVNANAAVAFQNINLAGSGSINVATTLQVSTNNNAQGTIALASGAKFSGSNANLSISSVAASTVSAAIGAYTLKCQTSCNAVSTSSTPTESFTFSA